MSLWADEYLTRTNGRKPVKQWLLSLSKKERAVVESKMQTLRERGFDLIKIRNLIPIKNRTRKERRDKCLYELVCGKFRIGTHYDSKRNIFIYLSVWKKQKNIQPRDITTCRTRLDEYLVQRGER